MSYASLLGSNIFQQKIGGGVLENILTDPYPRYKLTILATCRATGSNIYMFTYENNLLPNATLTSALTTIPGLNNAYLYNAAISGVSIAYGTTAKTIDPIWQWDLGAIKTIILHVALYTSGSIYGGAKLYISSDGTNWTLLGTNTTIVKKVTCRYIKIVGYTIAVSNATGTIFAGAKMAFAYDPANYYKLIELDPTKLNKLEFFITTPIDIFSEDSGAGTTISAYLLDIVSTTNKVIEYLDAPVDVIDV